MNIHPFIIHFPVAFLTLYALLELFRFRVVVEKTWYQPFKIGLLYAGAVGVVLAFVTGGIAEGIVLDTTHVPKELVERHELFVSLGGWLFIALAALHIGASKGKALALRLLKTPLVPIVALIALLSMSIGGALGAAIVHGPEADLMVKGIFKTFSGISLQ
jgi:uncharacterized membrane protein